MTKTYDGDVCIGDIDVTKVQPMMGRHPTGVYYKRMWYAECMRVANLIATVSRDAPDKPWIMNLRVRIYRDDRAHGSDDEKTAFTVEAPTEDLDKLCEGADAVVEGFCKTFADLGRVERECFDIDGGDDALIAKLQTKPWAHIKIVGTKKGIQ